MTREVIHKDDQGRITARLFFDEQNQLHGVCEFYEQGKLFFKGEYVHGKLHGPASTYHFNGQIQSTMYHHEGQLHGERVHYSEEGMITQIDTYDKGLLHGPFKSFHSNGAVASEGTYDHHIKANDWVHYYDNGEEIITEDESE